MQPTPVSELLVAHPHTAKSGSGRVLARVPAGKGHNGRLVLLDGAVVKLFRRIDKSESDEVWSHAMAPASEYTAAPAKLAPAPVAVPAPARKARTLPVFDAGNTVRPEPASPQIKPSPLHSEVADLVAGFASEADERADNEENPDTERKAARLVSRILTKLSVDIKAGRVAMG